MVEEGRVAQGCVVKISYAMKTYFPDGTMKERPEDTFEFIFGGEHQVPTLEAAIDEAMVGDRFSLNIPAEEIYGAHDPDLVREIPKKGLIKQRIREGQFYRRIKNGRLVSFRVLEIRPDTILADFNKPTAGITVSMELEVVAVREAGKKEIDAARETQRRREIGCG
jgi:FKBP-type peptidyl-prolyl cis-trans isomerase SlyD